MTEFVFYKPVSSDYWESTPFARNGCPKELTDERIISLSSYLTSDDNRIDPIIPVEDERDSSKYSKMFRWDDFIFVRWDEKDIEKIRKIEKERGGEMFLSEYFEMLVGFFWAKE